MSATLLCLITVDAARQGKPYVRHWRWLSVIFVLLSIDEAVMLHELSIEPVREWLDADGAFYYAWVIPGLAVVLVVGAAYVKFLLHLEQRYRWLFIASGSLYVGGALGMEMIGAYAATTQGFGSAGSIVAFIIEKSCEMLGVLLFIYALLDYISQNVRHVRIEF